MEISKYAVFAYNDTDDRLLVFSSASFPECVSVAQALYSASDLEFRVMNPDGACLVSFIKPELVDKMFN